MPNLFCLPSIIIIKDIFFLRRSALWIFIFSVVDQIRLAGHLKTVNVNPNEICLTTREVPSSCKHLACVVHAGDRLMWTSGPVYMYSTRSSWKTSGFDEGPNGPTQSCETYGWWLRGQRPRSSQLKATRSELTAKNTKINWPAQYWNWCGYCRKAILFCKQCYKL